MKVDKFYYRKVINQAKYFEFYLFDYFKNEVSSNANLKMKEELIYLIKNDSYHLILRHSKLSFWGNKVNIKTSLKNDFKLIEKYANLFENFYLKESIKDILEE